MATTSEAPVSAGAATHTTIRSSLGDLTVVARGGLVTGLYFPHHWYLPDRSAFGEYRDAGFGDVQRQLDEYLAGERREFDVPVEAAGSPFQEQVWRPDQPDPLRNDRELRRAGQRTRQDHGPGGRGRGGPQPGEHPHPLHTG